MTFRRAARVWSNRENCKDFGSKLSNSIFPRHWISSSSAFSGDPVTRSKRTHQWMSGVTMLVRWLCSFPASELLALVDPLVLPRPQGNAPLGNQGTREPTGCTLVKSRESRSCPVVLLSLDFGQGMHPNSLDKVRVRAVGPSCSQRATSNVPGNRGGLTKSKDKGKRPNQIRIAKRNERPSTHPEKNRQRPPDHQARRRSRKETLTLYPSGAKRKGESDWPARRKNVVDEDSQESPTAKTYPS